MSSRLLVLGTLRVAPDGGAAVVRTDHELHGVDPRSVSSRWCVEVASVRDHAIVGDEVWAATPSEVVRLDLATGETRGRHGVPTNDGALATTPWVAGTAASAGNDAWALTVDKGAATVARLGACEVAIPIGRDAFVAANAGAVELRRSTGAQWTTRLDGGAAIHGAVILEGRAAALCQRTPGSAAVRIVVVNLRDGGILHSLAAPGATQIAFASRRGWAVVRSGPQRLTVVDLRLGRIVDMRESEEPIADLAVDAAFEHVLLSIGDPVRLVVADGHELLTASPREVRIPEAAAVHVVEPVPALPVPPDAEPPSAPVLVVGPLLGLANVLHGEAAPEEERAVDLQARLSWIGALVERAIAEGWDSGRIAAPSTVQLPFEHEVTATLHHVRGRATAQLELAREHVEHYGKVLAELDRRRGDRLTALARLARELGLSPLATDLVIAIAAPLLWGELARLYGILSNDRARPLCDELLLYQVMAPRATRGEIARELDPDGPLCRSGVVVVDVALPRPFGALTVEPLVIALLRGIEPEIAAEDVHVRPATVGLDAIRIAPRVRDRMIATFSTPGETPARIALRGRPGSGRRTFAAALAATCERPLAIVESRRELDPDSRTEHLCSSLLRCRMLGWIPCIEGLDDLAVVDHPDTPALAAALADHAGPIFLRLSSDATAPLAPGHLVLDLAVLSEGERVAVWTEALRAKGVRDDDAAQLGARYRVGPGVIARSVEVAAAAVRTEELEPVPEHVTPRIDLAVRQHLEDRLGTTATRVTRLAGWADLVLPEDVLDTLLELVSRVRRRRLVFESWGYDRRITSARGLTALFQGGPGTGKTLAAGVIARELGLDLYRIDLARVVSKWVGETQKNLASVFDAAEDGQAILLFDEADSLFAKRTDVKSSVDRYANLEVNYLLQRLDTFEGIAILTTNLATSIDPAFKRRMGMRLTFPFPDEEMREHMWKAHVPPEVPRRGELDFRDLAHRFHLSGGYIRNAALRAAFLAAEEGVGLAQQHLERAIRLEYREIGKLSETGMLE